MIPTPLKVVLIIAAIAAITYEVKNRGSEDNTKESQPPVEVIEVEVVESGKQEIDNPRKPLFTITAFEGEETRHRKRYVTFNYEFLPSGAIKMKDIGRNTVTVISPPFTIEQGWADSSFDK
jgi:hypothetical protein